LNLLLMGTVQAVLRNSGKPPEVAQHGKQERRKDCKEWPMPSEYQADRDSVHRRQNSTMPVQFLGGSVPKQEPAE
jgi:hypothetical protein